MWCVLPTLSLIAAQPLRRRVAQLQEFGSKYEAETLRNPKKTDLADVIVYVHDSSDTNSFSYISNLRVRLFCALSPCAEQRVWSDHSRWK